MTIIEMWKHQLAENLDVLTFSTPARQKLDILHRMKVFSRVARMGSYTTAARAIGMTIPQTSRVITDLETYLQTRLFHRNTRRLALTEAGERYLNRCVKIIEEVEDAELEARKLSDVPEGRLKIHAMTGFGARYIVPLITRFTDQYNQVDADLTLLQEIPDLATDGFDISIILADTLPDSNYVSQRLGMSHSIACASPAYLARYGMPKCVDDLATHHCLQLVTPGESPNVWVFESERELCKYDLTRSRISVNVPDALKEATLAGAGIAVLPISSAAGDLMANRLIRVLPQYSLHKRNVFAIYPSRQYLAAKTRIWLEFLKSELPELLKRDAMTTSEVHRGSAYTIA